MSLAIFSCIHMGRDLGDLRLVPEILHMLLCQLLTEEWMHLYPLSSKRRMQNAMFATSATSATSATKKPEEEIHANHRGR